MKKPGIIKAKVDAKVKVNFAEWADREGRSEQRHAAILLQKLTTMTQTDPGELARLGLMDRLATISR